jgi:predicted N-acyltransferase
MQTEISPTIRDVKEKEWEILTGTDYIEHSHGWFRTIEDSGSRDMRYVYVREDGKLRAAACSYVYEEEMYSIRMKFLDVRSFFFTTPEQADMLMKGLEKIRTKEKAKGIMFLFLKDKEYLKIKNCVKGFTELLLKEDTYLDLNFTDFDDYLSFLSEDAWRSARMTLKRASKEWKIRTVFTNEFSEWKETTHRLQGYLCERHDAYRSHFPEQFYVALEKNMKDNAELMIFFKDDIFLAFGLPFYSSTICEHKLIGVDPKYRKYQAYFLFYYEGIRRAIERGQKRMYFGSTTYEFKERIGCKREKLHGLVKMENPFLNILVRLHSMGYKLLGKKF